MIKLKLTCPDCDQSDEIFFKTDQGNNPSFIPTCDKCGRQMNKKSIPIDADFNKSISSFSWQDNNNKKQPEVRFYNQRSSKNKTDLINKMHEKYKTHKTLEKVAQEFGYTRERVRQYLVLGNKLGIINYKPFNRENFKILQSEMSCDHVIKLLEEHGAVRRISEKTGVSIAHLNRLFEIYNIDVSKMRKKYLQKEITKEYFKLVESLDGKHPSTYDLLAIDNGRNLWAKISRNWGTFKKFREENNIQIEKKAKKKKKRATFASST